MTTSAGISTAGAAANEGPRQRCGNRRIALEPLGVPEQKHSHAVSALGENAGGDKTVAAVVSRPGDHCDAHARGVPRRDRLGNRPTGVFHELDPRSAARNRAAVSLCHLGGGE